MRKLASIAVTAGLLVTLSACSGTPFNPGACSPTYVPGDNSALVTADGGFGQDPSAGFPTPLVAAGNEARVLEAGEGDPVAIGATVDVQITVYDAASGERVISTDYAGTGLRAVAAGGQAPFGAIAQCAPAGSRVVAVGRAADLLGETAITDNGIPLELDDTTVIVLDVLRSYLGRANGVDQLPQAGFPSIVLAPDGRPGFTFPSAVAPTGLVIALLKAGNGAEVQEGDTVVLHYSGVEWDGVTTFDSTWDSGVPASLVATDFTTTSDGTGVVPGFAQAIIGQKVGSQVIVVIPPELGYPAGSAPASIGENATMVFVIDVLGIE